MVKKNTQDIPKILQFVWINNKEGRVNDIPNIFYQNFLNTLKLVETENNNWKIKIWMDQEVDSLPRLKEIKNLDKQEIELININTPGAIFNLDTQDSVSSSHSKIQKKIYDKSHNLAIKIDVLKYQILKEDGGIINDWNFIYKKLPTDLELNKYDLVLYHLKKDKSFSGMIENSFMASTPKHPFIKEVQKGVVVNVKKLKYCLDENPRFPQDIEDFMQQIAQDGRFGKSIIKMKQVQCSTDITTDHLTDIKLESFSHVAISYVFRDNCLNDVCFGYDPIPVAGGEIVQTWLET